MNFEEDVTFADIFAGGGGVGTGALSVEGVKVLWALNHNKKAIECNAKNHPETKHYRADIRTQNVMELDPVDIVWASIECTQHSKAKGGGNKDIGSYTLGWELMRYIVHANPYVIFIENVPEFLKWAPIDSEGNPIKSRQGEEFKRWRNAIKDLGYPNFEYRILNAADYNCPTRRLRFFGIFTAPGVEICWPEQSNNEKGTFNMQQWVPCRDFIDLKDEGISIFGRQFNIKIRKQNRKPLSKNTQRRIAGGIKRYAPEMHKHMLMTYHGQGHNCHLLDEPLSTISTVEAKVLITVEKMQFIQDHCHCDNYNLLDEPLNPQLTRETKQLITAQFISKQYNSNNHPEYNNQSIDEPLSSITTQEKMQFISAYFNSSGHPETQNKSIDKPLNSITTGENKQAVVTYIPGIEDFDIKMRFLNPYSELGPIMGFPPEYFTGYSRKDATKMIGNAVPSGMAKVLISSMKPQINKLNYKTA